jgi:hypothetical protein
VAVAAAEEGQVPAAVRGRPLLPKKQTSVGDRGEVGLVASQTPLKRARIELPNNIL